MKDRKRSPFASDDRADSLLADILDETEEDARREEAELERSIARREAEERRAAERAREQQLAERHAKLEKELARQEELKKRRTQKMQALRIDDTPAEEPERETTPDPEELREEIRQQVRREIANTPVPRPAPASPEPRESRGRTGWLAAAAAVLVAGLVGAAGFAYTSQYETDRSAYAKAVFAPADRDTVAMEVGFTPVPKPPEAADEPETDRQRPPRIVRKPPPEEADEKDPEPTKSAWGKPAENEASKSLSRFEKMLEDADDPYTIDE